MPTTGDSSTTISLTASTDELDKSELLIETVASDGKDKSAEQSVASPAKRKRSAAEAVAEIVTRPITQLLSLLGVPLQDNGDPVFISVPDPYQSKAVDSEAALTKVTKPTLKSVNATTPTGQHNPDDEDAKLKETLETLEGRMKTLYFKRRLFELAVGEAMDIEIENKPSLAKVAPGFYSSRAELVRIINERLYLILHNRSYPGHWSELLFEPILVARDNGLVTVATGFHEPMSGATSDLLHLVPTISSSKVIKFLGLDLRNWIWDEEGNTHVFTVRGTDYLRRDSVRPIKMTLTAKWQVPKAGIDALKTFTNKERKEIDAVRELFYWNNWESKTLLVSTEEQLEKALKPKFRLPQFLYVYADIAAPVAVGNTRASILRITTLKSTETNKDLGHRPPEKYVKIFFVPVSRRRFDTIEIFLSDENGSELAFDEGTVYVVLEFRKRIPLVSALSYLLQ